MRAEFGRVTRRKAFARAAGHCEQCTAPLTWGKFAYDHINPSEFSADASLRNCQVLCVSCHEAKTAKRDIPAIAKSNRIRDTAAGIRKDRHIRAWRNFAGEIVRKPARRGPQ